MKSSSLHYLMAFTILVVLVVLASCRWTPQRDNPVDPFSPFYVPPPLPNNAPQIDTVYITTEYIYYSTSDAVSFNIYADVMDIDGNLDYNNVSAHVILDAHIDSIILGNLGYDPGVQEFFLHMKERDLPGDLTVSQLTGHPLIISARDDSGATVDHSISFIEALKTPIPEINEPSDNDVVTAHPRLRWFFWNGPRDHTFKVEVIRNEYVYWDSAGLLASDTALTVTDSLPNSGGGGGTFSWRLTVRTDQDNTVTTKQAYFTVTN